MDLTTTEQQEAQTIREMLVQSRDFRPFAVFDERLDCIRVVIRDCSFTEIRVDDFLTVLEANYPVSGVVEFVGFTIKGVAHLCETLGISATGPWKIATFLDAALEASQDPVARPVVYNTVRPMAEKYQLDVVERTAA